VAEAIRASGVPREEVFVSTCRNYLLPGIRAYFLLLQPLNVFQKPTDMNQLVGEDEVWSVALDHRFHG
jgi:hypothetical protein